MAAYTLVYTEEWTQVTRLEQPMKKPHEALVTGLFFTKTKGRCKTLFVAYMHHGIL